MINNAIRDIFGALDKVVYLFVELIMQLIMDLANVEIFTDSLITTFSRRIYIILGLVMLFKIMISFMQILINPDKMSDKEQGMGNVLKRVVISLILIALVPSIFRLARQLQAQVIPVIPKVVLGAPIDLSSEEGAEKLSSMGQMMAFYSFSPFFTYDNESCNDGSILGTGGDPSAAKIWSVGTATAGENLKETNICSTDSNGYKYKYSFGLSTFVGIYLVFMLVQVALAIAIRAIKLGICEFIAPIPIASYIDPKTSKQAFSNWVNTSLKTYADLFIRLIVVYFVLFIFLTVFDEGNIAVMYDKLGGDLMRSSLVTLFIIIGLLQFVKQAPKFICDMLGIKDTGGDIAGMFKGEGWKQLGTSAGGLVGTVGAAAGAGIGNYRYARKNGEGRLTALRRGLTGSTAATIRGGLATVGGKGWKGAFSDNVAKTTGNSHRRVNKKAIARQSRTEYNDAINELNDNMTTLNQRRGRLITNLQDVDDQLSAAIAVGDTARVAHLTAVHNSLESRIADTDEEIEKVNRQKENVARPISPLRNFVTDTWNKSTGMQSISGSSLIEASSTLSSMRSTYYIGEAMKKLSEEGSQLPETLSMGATYSQVASAYKSLANGTVTSVTIGGQTYHQNDIQKVEELFKKAEKEAAINYINAVKAGRIQNTTIQEGIKQSYGALDGLGIDAATKKKLVAQLDSKPGNFFKDLSDISKRLETEGKRRQAYEREQKKNN